MKKNRLLQGAIVVTLLCGCTSKTTTTSNKDVYSNADLTEDLFNTVYAYTEYNTDSGQEHFEKSTELLRKYNNLFDIYNNYDGLNNLKTINDNAGKEKIKVSPIIIDMLLEAKKFYEYSGGEFDVTSGALLKVWHEYREEGLALNADGKQGNLPSEEELTEAAKHSGWDKIEIDEEASTVYITDPEVSLDVGGIAKGYAAELLAHEMMQTGMKDGILNVGRNIRLVGHKPNNQPWGVGITDPEGAYPSGIVSFASEEPVSVVTSGDYERFYVASDGEKYPHIIDPETMYPARLYHSVSIITEDSGAADCLSTTLFTLSIEDGKEVLQKYTSATGKSAEAVWMMDTDKTQSQNGKTIGSYYIVATDKIAKEIQW